MSTKNRRASRTRRTKLANPTSRKAANAGRSVNSSVPRDIAMKVAKLVLDKSFNGGGTLMTVNGLFYHYRDGVWQIPDEQWLRGRILRVLKEVRDTGQISSVSLMNNALEVLRARQARRSNPFDSSGTRHFVNCKNGEVWFDKRGDIDFRQHDPASHFNYQIDAEYDPNAICPIYDKTLLEIFANSSAPKAMRRHWHELSGYMVQSSREFAIVPVLFGIGRNGKTLLIKVVIGLLGPKLVYAAPVAELKSDKWATGHLAGKRVFLDDDVDKDIVLPDGILKTISERKAITGQRKYQNKFDVDCAVVPVLLCNNIPTLRDMSAGMLHRFQVVPFDRTFEGRAADRTLLSKILEGEAPGVLNRMIAGYSRLLRRGNFKIPGPVRLATKRWIANASVLQRFIDQKCKTDPALSVFGDPLYKAFQKFVRDEGVPSCPTKQTFYADLEHRGFSSTHGKKGKKFSGISIG